MGTFLSGYAPLKDETGKTITNLTKATNKISQGELDVQLPEIKSRNEIYELNEGLKSVVAAVEFLKDVAAEKNNEQKK